MRLAVLAMKGGVGKTTTAVVTALTLATDGADVLLVDADEDQQSATGWADMARDAGDWPDTLTVRPWSTQLTRSVLDRHDHVVFDLGPKRRELTRNVLRLADTAVIPTAPRRGDFAEIHPAIELVQQAGDRQPLAYGVLLTMVRRGTRAGREARDEITDGLQLPVLDAEVPLGERYADMFGRVPTDPGAYRELTTELVAESLGGTRGHVA